LQGLDPVSGSTNFSVVSNLGNGTTSAFAGGSGGLYPYLSSFFPGGIQAVSGFAYNYKAGITMPLASGPAGAATVSVAGGGAGVGSATTGANGYYYVLVPAGTFAADAGVVAFTQFDATTHTPEGASFTQSTGAANTAGLDVWGKWRRDQPGSGLTTLSALDATYAATIGATAPSGFTLANRQITAPASFTVDQDLTASGSANITTLGDLTIASTGSVSGSAVTLAATGAFINNRGSDAVTATSDRWLIYSANPAGDTFGGLDSGNTAIWNTAPGAVVSQSGNRYVFAYQPTLTVSSTSAAKVYGTDATSQIAGNYMISGFAPGVAGAYLGDTAANVISGMPTVTSIGAAATAAVSGSPYAITVSQGSLTAGAGYALSFANTGTLTVTPRPITAAPEAIQSTPASQIVQADFRPAFVPISAVAIGGTPNMSRPLGTGIFISDPRFDQAFVFFGVMPPYRGQL
jgi:hypothetical protein